MSSLLRCQSDPGSCWTVDSPETLQTSSPPLQHTKFALDQLTTAMHLKAASRKSSHPGEDMLGKVIGQWPTTPRERKLPEKAAKNWREAGE